MKSIPLVFAALTCLSSRVAAEVTSVMHLQSDRVTVTTNESSKPQLRATQIWQQLQSLLNEHHLFTGVQVHKGPQHQSSVAGGGQRSEALHHVFLGIKHSSIPPSLFSVQVEGVTCPTPNTRGCLALQRVTVTGPIASYRVTNPLEDPQALLNGKQSFVWTAGTLPTGPTLSGQFIIHSLDFERAVGALAKSYLTTKAQVSRADVLRLAGRFIKSVNQEVLR